MASRTMKKGGHTKRAVGGKAEMKADKKTQHLYNAAGSPEAHEAEDEVDDFKKGGKARKRKDGGKAEGKAAKERGDRKPRAKRAAGGHTPFTSGHNTTDPKSVNDGHESERP